MGCNVLLYRLLVWEMVDFDIFEIFGVSKKRDFFALF